MLAVGPEHDGPGTPYGRHSIEEPKVISHPQLLTLVPGAEVIDHATIRISVDAHVDEGVLRERFAAFVDATADVTEIAQAEREFFQTIDVGRIGECHVDGTADVLGRMAILSEDFLAGVG